MTDESACDGACEGARANERADSREPDDSPTREPRIEVLVIGFGNALRQDDGAGPAVIERLRRQSVRVGTVLLDTHQLLPEMAELAGRADRLVLIDASLDHAAGTIRLRRVLPGRVRTLGHRLAADELVRIARELFGGPRRAMAYTIGVESLELGEHFSPAVERAVERLTARLAGKLAASGPNSQPPSNFS